MPESALSGEHARRSVVFDFGSAEIARVSEGLARLHANDFIPG